MRAHIDDIRLNIWNHCASDVLSSDSDKYIHTHATCQLNDSAFVVCLFVKTSFALLNKIIQIVVYHNENASCCVLRLDVFHYID